MIYISAPTEMETSLGSVSLMLHPQLCALHYCTPQCCCKSALSCCEAIQWSSDFVLILNPPPTHFVSIFVSELMACSW